MKLDNLLSITLFLCLTALVSAFDCPDNGIYADPDECQCYYECANLQPYHMCCNDGTMFDMESCTCNYVNDVDCGERPNGLTTTSTSTSTTTTTTTTTSTTSVQLPSWDEDRQERLKKKHFCPDCKSSTDAIDYSIKRNEFFYPHGTGENTVFVAALIVNEYEIDEVGGHDNLTWISTEYAIRYDCKNIPKEAPWVHGSAKCTQSKTCKPGPLADSTGHLFYRDLTYCYDTPTTMDI